MVCAKDRTIATGILLLELGQVGSTNALLCSGITLGQLGELRARMQNWSLGQQIFLHQSA